MTIQNLFGMHHQRIFDILMYRWKYLSHSFVFKFHCDKVLKNIEEHNHTMSCERISWISSSNKCLNQLKYESSFILSALSKSYHHFEFFQLNHQLQNGTLLIWISTFVTYLFTHTVFHGEMEYLGSVSHWKDYSQSKYIDICLMWNLQLHMHKCVRISICLFLKVIRCQLNFDFDFDFDR